MSVSTMAPRAIEFDSISGAAAYRENSGGWIFVSDCGARFIVFPKGRPSEIMTAPQTRGLSGSLV